MLKECYSFVKIWLKLQKGKVRLAAFPRYSIALFAVTLPLLLLLFSPDSFARSDCQQFGAQGSANYELEVAASGEGRSRLGASAFALSDSYPVASEVWQVLLQDAVIARLKLPFQWRFALVDDGSMNAFSFPDGEVVVDRKLASCWARIAGYGQRCCRMRLHMWRAATGFSDIPMSQDSRGVNPTLGSYQM